MNYYAFHIGDYAKDTAHLGMVEDAAYRRLLDLYYSREAPLPTDDRQLCRLVRAQSEAEREAVQIVLGEFFTKTDDGWRHARCDAEIAKASEKKAKASQSAARRWSNANAMRTHTETHANAMRTHTEKHANALPTQTEGNAPNPNPNPNPKEKTKDGADAPDVDVWSFGMELLTKQGGLGPGTARSYIGALCKSWPETTVLDALMAAAGKADPKAYARKWLDDKPRKGQRALSAAEELMAELEAKERAENRLAAA